MRPAKLDETAENVGTPDAEWRSLVTEAALAAGVVRSADAPADDPMDTRRHLSLAEPGMAATPLAEAIRAHTSTGDFSIAEGRRAPRTALEAKLKGELIADATIYKSSSRVDVAARELGLTCQVGQFSVHDAAHSAFSAEEGCAFGAYNAAAAGIVASVPAHELQGARSGRVTAKLCLPVLFDNTLQRIWRLAVPSRDMLIDAERPHFAVVGLRGSICLGVEAADGEVASVRTRFLSRSLSAHEPSNELGFGPAKGAHVLEVDVPTIDPSRDLEITLTVSLMSLIAGDPGNYKQGAPFYAGIDFGGNGSVRLPHECLSAFEIPLTPLIGNDPITVSEIAFREHQDDDND